MEIQGYLDLHYNCQSNITCEPYSIALKKGIYKFEVWGASGSSGWGDNTYNPYDWISGAGYSSGIINIQSTALFYIYIGAMPNFGSKYGGYNGGGNDIDTTSGPGGGATDVRLIGGEWNNTISLNSRILVAGGSGGGHEKPWGKGGAGGGFNGIDGIQEGYYAYLYDTLYGGGGNQTTGGIGGNSSACPAYRPTPSNNYGSFGSGGEGYDGGGGGGGWYGGGGGMCGIGGGGGSGFIWCQNSSHLVPHDYSPDSSYYFENPISIPGNSSMPSPSGQTQIGHIGHGFARISSYPHIKNTPNQNCSQNPSIHFLLLQFSIALLLII